MRQTLSRFERFCQTAREVYQAQCLRTVYDSAVNEVEIWNKSAAAQFDSQLRDRRRHFTRRIEAVSRIQQAAGGLDERITELQGMQAALTQVDAKLAELTELLTAPVAEDTAEPLSV